MNTRKTELPAWAEKYHTEGTTLRKRGNAYMLLRVSSRCVKDRPYPVLDQEYLGMVDEAGFHPKKRSGSGVRFVEWGLSAFILDRYRRDLQRNCYGTTGDAGLDVVTLAVIAFVHGTAAESALRLSLCGTSRTAQLSKRREMTNPKRIATIVNAIGRMLEKDFPDKEARSEAVALMRMEVCPEGSSAACLSHSDEVQRILEELK